MEQTLALLIMHINAETHITHNATWLHLFIRACSISHRLIGIIYIFFCLFFISFEPVWTCVWAFDPPITLSGGESAAPHFPCEMDELPICGAPLQHVINCGHHGSAGRLFSLIGYRANYLWIPANAISPIDLDLPTCVTVIRGLVCYSRFSLCAFRTRVGNL